MRQRRNQPSRSPLARAASVGHGASAPGQEGVLQPLPGLSRVYSANPRSSESIPPMPVMMHHPSLPPIGGPQLGQPLSRKTSGLSMTPRTSYSSTTQAAYNSPVMSLAPIGYAPAAAAMSYASGDLGYGQPPFPPTLYQTGYPPPPLPMMQPGPSIEQRLGMPMTTSQQSNYQMMTLSSSGGGTYSLPVDVSAASKQADEKRRRNAGASHRFRERRKQKEKESNTQISNLEEDLRVTTDLKEAAEDDCDHYRTERDFLLQLIRNEAPQITVPPRPATPRHSRPALPPPRPRTMETSESVEPPSAVPQQQVFSTYPSLAGPSPYGPAVPLGPMMSGQPGADTMQHLPQGVSGPGIDPGYAQYPPLQHPPVARQPPADQMRYGSYPGPRP